MIKDNNIAWKTKRDFVRCRVMAGVLDDAVSGIPAALGAGGALFAESVAAAEIGGALIGAAGDEIYDIWPIPWDMDRDKPLRFRYLFSHSEAAADEPVFKTHYKFIGKGVAITDAGSSPDELVTHTAHVNAAVADAIELTAWAKSASHTKIADTDIAMLVCHEVDSLGSASGDELTVYGVEIEYTVKATDTDNRRHTTDDEPV